MFSNAISIDVIDPLNRTGKISIPLQYVFDTRGVTENRPACPQSGGPKDMSLCLLFQKGRCNAGVRCHQVHADVDFVTKLRFMAAAGASCCAAHGDFCSQGFTQVGGIELAVCDPVRNESRTFPLAAFARTSALDGLLASAAAGGTLRVHANKVCRLHQQSRCKFGRDCKNFHVCPQTAMNTPAVPLSSAAAACAASAPSSASPMPSHAFLNRCNPPKQPAFLQTPSAAAVSSLSAEPRAFFGASLRSSFGSASFGGSGSLGFSGSHHAAACAGEPAQSSAFSVSSGNGLSQHSTPRSTSATSRSVSESPRPEVVFGGFGDALELSLRPMPLTCIGTVTPATAVASSSSSVKPLPMCDLESSMGRCPTLKSLAASTASPQNFDASGFENTLSLLVEDLMNLTASPLAGPSPAVAKAVVA